MLKLCILFLYVYLNGVNSEYQIVFQKANVAFADKATVDCQVRLDPYNETINFFNWNMTYYQAPTKESQVIFKVYVLQGDVYKLSGVQFKNSFYNLLSFKYFDMERMFLSFEPSMTWPIATEKTYRLKNYYPDNKKLPPYMPEGNTKAVVEMYLNYDRNKFLTVEIFSLLKHVK